MKKLLLIIIMLIVIAVLSGCNSIHSKEVQEVYRVLPDRTEEYEVTTFTEDDESFTIGTKGWGEYHFLELSFM
jgi:uncharacterized protein YceK